MAQSDSHISIALQEQCHWGSWNANRGIEAGFRCEYCGCDLLSSVDAYYSWQMDHITPKSHDGDHSYENIAICCRTCNSMKQAYKPVGNTREERTADARRFIIDARNKKFTELNRIREIVGLPPLENEKQ